MNKRPTLTLNDFKKNNTSNSADIVEKANESDISKNNNNTQSVQDASDKKKSKVVTADAANAKKQNLINDEDYLAILSYMQEHYPKCFPTEAKLIALSIGLHHQLFAIENIPFSRMKLRKFLQRYTGSKEYRQSLIIGNDRFDLDGRPTSKILEAEANHWQWKRLKAEKKDEEIKKANHDSLIKKAMESPVAAKELLAEYLPAEFRDFIDLDTLALEKESYIEDSLKTRFSDIVYSAKIKSNANAKAL